MSKLSEESAIGLLDVEDGPAWSPKKRFALSDLRSQLGNTRLRIAAGVLGVLGLCYTLLSSTSKSSSFNAVRIPLPLNATEMASLSQLTAESLAYQRAFTDAECDYLFGDLYDESTRAKQFWKAKGGITQDLVDQAQPLSNARVIIKDNQLYVRHFNNGLFTRAYAQLALINEAVISAKDPLPDVDFTFAVHDWPHGEVLPMWELTRENTTGTNNQGTPQSWMMPDYGFFAWPEPGVGAYTAVMRKTQEKEQKLGSWDAKTKQIFWKGAFWVNGLREKLYRKLEGKPWADISDMNWGDRPAETKKNIDDHCQHKYLAHIEGGSSSGRLKYIQGCRSVIVIHPLRWVQHFHHLINTDPDSPEQNAVLVPGEEWEGVEEIMQGLMADEAKAERIATNSYHFWRYWNSPAATACYTRKMIRDWAEIQTFKPQLQYEDAAYPSFDLMRATRWDIH